MAKQITLDLDLWPRQMTAFQSFAQELLYGGAAGGGKSHWERIMSISLCMDIPGLQYYLFRRSYSDLQKSYVEGPTGYNAMLGELIHEGAVESVAKEIRFPNESKIYLCHAQHEKNVLDFGSFEFHVLNIAEAGQFTPFMIKYLRSRVRMGEDFKKKIPKHYIIPKEYWRDQTKPEYSLPRAIYTCNPIGPGKDFLKKNFVDGHQPDEIWRAEDEDGGMIRQFVPAKLGDNPSLDPVAYSASLKGIGNDAYVQALLDGNWKTTIGAFFPQIDVSRHLIRPFMIPEHWPKLMVYDHGSCGEGDPFSIGWYAISDGTIPVVSSYTKEPMLCQRDSLICYRRWNGAGLPKTNVIEIANGIKERETENVLFRIAGGDIVEQRGLVMSEDLRAKGESVFTLFRKHGIAFVMADRRRQNGWAQVDYRLSGENGYPLSFWFDHCYEDLETMSNLQSDPMNPGDILPRQNDHDCVVGETLVDTIEGPVQIKHLVGKKGFVFTKEGVRAAFEDCRLIRKACEVWKVTFTDGRNIIATPDHRFLLDCGEWRELQHLRPNDKIASVTSFIKAYENRNHIRDVSGIFRETLLQMRTVFQFAKEKFEGLFSTSSSCLAVPSWGYSEWYAYSPQRRGCFEQSDRKPGANSRWQTLKHAHDNSSSKGQILSDCQDSQRKNATSNPSLEAQRGRPEVLQGEGSEKSLGEGLSSRKALRVLWQILSDFVNKSLSIKILSSKLQNESNATTVKTVSYNGIADVYCLTVPGYGAFSVNGGIVISNCDRHRYACMTRPIARDQQMVQPAHYEHPMRQATPQQLIKMINKPKKSAYVTRQ